MRIILDKWLEKLCLILWKCFLLSDRPGLQYWEMQAGRCGLIRLYFDWVKITLHHQHPLQIRISVLAIVCRGRGEQRERGSQDAKLDTTTQMRAMQLATISSPLPNKLIKHYSQIYHYLSTNFFRNIVKLWALKPKHFGELSRAAHCLSLTETRAEPHFGVAHSSRDSLLEERQAYRLQVRFLFLLLMAARICLSTAHHNIPVCVAQSQKVFFFIFHSFSLALCCYSECVLLYLLSN